jgi:biopolymer transport protein ExbD
MKRTFFISFLMVLFVACSGNKAKLIGSWIEKDNFKEPLIIEFYKNNTYKMYPSDKFATNGLYQIDKDTLFTQHYFGIQKTKLVFTNTELKFIDLVTDTVTFTFEKGDFADVLEYFNHKKKANIVLPQLETFEFDRSEHEFSIYCDSLNNIYLNGKKIVLSELAKHLPKPENEMYGFTHLYCDRNVKYSGLSKIKAALAKNGLRRLSYITTYYQKGFSCLTVRLPDLSEDFSMLDDFPREIFNRNILEITNDLIKLNEVELAANELNAILRELLIKHGEKFILYIYFDDNVCYENYLKEMKNIRKAYFSVRHNYSKEHFNQSDYEMLGYNENKLVMDLYPMRILEINQKMKIALFN